jgi:hypothetical protein
LRLLEKHSLKQLTRAVGQGLRSNAPESWTEVMGSQRLTGAFLDRLTHRVHILEANGESFRLQDSVRRCKKQPAEKKS